MAQGFLGDEPEINAAAGEVPLQIGSQKMAIAVTFRGLSRIAQATGIDSLDQLYRRLIGFEPHTVSVALMALSVDGGDRERAETRARVALGQLSAADETAFRVAISAALAAHLEHGQKVRGEVKSLADEVDEALDPSKKAGPDGA